MDSIQLGPWLFKPADFSISDATQRKELEPLLVKLLCCFATEPGRIISRQELIDNIWQQSYVDDNAINRAISELRKALQHPQLGQSPIKTHHRKGYSLQLQPDTSAMDPLLTTSAETHTNTKPAGKIWYSLAGLLVASVVAVVMYFSVQTTTPEETAKTNEVQAKRPTVNITNRQIVTWFKGIESRPLISPDKQLLAYSHSQPDGSIRTLVRKLGINTGNLLQEVALEMFSRKASAVATNVPGPQMPLYLGGSCIRDLMFWVPQTGTVGLGVSILSYGGGVQFGLITDAALCAEPQAIIDRFEPEFQQLLLLALMLPWGDAAA